MPVELRNKPRDFFKHLKCKLDGGHEYDFKYEVMTNGGMGKMRVYKCAKCGHEYCYFV